MEFTNLKAQYQKLQSEINQNIANVLERGDYILGKEVRMLEEKLAIHVGRKYCVSCANGTDAMTMALMAWGIGPGDAVFVPSFTFFATSEVVSLSGATPIFVDITLDTYNMCPTSLKNAIETVKQEKKLTPKLIITVDLFGQCADYSAILPLAQKHNLLVLEDAAQSFGAEQNGVKACKFGDISTTSFFPSKPLGCYGDGGAIFTDSDELYELLTSIRVHGKGRDKYDNVRIGLNSRLDTIQAAILLPKFKALVDYELDLRNRWAERYTQLLKGHVITPEIAPNNLSAWAQYTIRVSNRVSIVGKLAEAGVPSNVYYPKALHQQTVYRHTDFHLPNSEQSAREVLSLPFSPYVTEAEIEKVTGLLS